MASQKFTKVTLFFNCKLLYGGENKIFASKSEMVSKLTQISDGKKEINFINGRTVPFSKEFSMHFKWEEFPTYRDNPFNYPNYAVFTDGTVKRTFGYFVTSSNTKNLPSDTVELFFKYDSFINNSDVIKNLKNKPIERYTMDGYIKGDGYLLYNDFSTTEFMPNVVPTSSDIPSSADFDTIKYLRQSVGSIMKIDRVPNVYVIFIKYILDETATISLEDDRMFNYFPDSFPLKVLYIPYCAVTDEGVLAPYLSVSPIKKFAGNSYYSSLGTPVNFIRNQLTLPPFQYSPQLEYLDSKAVYKCFTCEPCSQHFYVNPDSPSVLFMICDNFVSVKSINNVSVTSGFCFFNYRSQDIDYSLKNYYKFDIDMWHNLRYMDNINKIKATIGALNVFPFKYYSLKCQSNEVKLVPLYQQNNFIGSESHILKSLGNKNNLFNFLYKSKQNTYPYFFTFSTTSPIPISKSAIETYLQSNNNQIQNGIKYAEINKALNQTSEGISIAAGAGSGFVNMLFGYYSGAINSVEKAGKSAINILKEEENLKYLISSNAAKLNDLKNVNSAVTLGDIDSVNRLVQENVPLILKYEPAVDFEVNSIALYFNKYGIKYNAMLSDVFSENHENFDYFKFSTFDEQEIDIQPNDERNEVYNMLIDGVRIWYNLSMFGEENAFNLPLSFNFFEEVSI